jgi:hypothetical protein
LPDGARLSWLRSMTSEQHSCLPVFLHIRHAANFWKLNDLRIEPSRLAEFHR